MENVFTKWLSLSGVKQVAVTKPYEYKGWVTMNGAHIFIGGGGGGGGGGGASSGGGAATAAEAIPAHESIAKVAKAGLITSHTMLQDHLNAIKLPSNYHLQVSEVKKVGNGQSTFSADIKGGSGNTIIGTVSGVIDPVRGVEHAKVAIHGYTGSEHLPHVTALTNTLSDHLKQFNNSGTKPSIEIAPKVAAKLSGTASDAVSNHTVPSDVTSGKAPLSNWQDVSSLYNKPADVAQAALQNHLNTIKLPSNYHLDVAHVGSANSIGTERAFSADIRGGAANSKIGTVSGNIHPAMGIVDAKITIHGYTGSEHLPHVNDLTASISDGLSSMSTSTSSPHITIAPKVILQLHGGGSLATSDHAPVYAYEEVGALHSKPADIIQGTLQHYLNETNLPSNYHLDVKSIGTEASTMSRHTFTADIKGGQSDTKIGTVTGVIDPKKGLVDTKISIHGYTGSEHLPHVNDITNSISNHLQGFSGSDVKPSIVIAPKVLNQLNNVGAGVPLADVAHSAENIPQVGLASIANTPIFKAGHDAASNVILHRLNSDPNKPAGVSYLLNEDNASQESNVVVDIHTKNVSDGIGTVMLTPSGVGTIGQVIVKYNHRVLEPGPANDYANALASHLTEDLQHNAGVPVKFTNYSVGPGAEAYNAHFNAMATKSAEGLQGGTPFGKQNPLFGTTYAMGTTHEDVQPFAVAAKIAIGNMNSNYFGGAPIYYGAELSKAGDTTGITFSDNFGKKFMTVKIDQTDPTQWKATIDQIAPMSKMDLEMATTYFKVLRAKVGMQTIISKTLPTKFGATTELAKMTPDHYKYMMAHPEVQGGFIAALKMNDPKQIIAYKSLNFVKDPTGQVPGALSYSIWDNKKKIGAGVLKYDGANMSHVAMVSDVSLSNTKAKYISGAVATTKTSLSSDTSKVGNFQFVAASSPSEKITPAPDAVTGFSNAPQMTVEELKFQSNALFKAVSKKTSSASALKGYTAGGSTGASSNLVNSTLRGTYDPAKNVGIYKAPAIKTSISNIDSLMKSPAAVLQHETIVTRGWGWDGLKISIPGYNEADAKAGLYNGTVFTDKGFTSTTAVQDAAFAGHRTSIELPKGTIGASVNGHSGYPNEHEYLLARGTSYKVLGWDAKSSTLRIRVDSQPAPGSLPIDLVAAGTAQAPKRAMTHGEFKRLTGSLSWIMPRIAN